MQSLRERDQSLINHWYIACLSHEIKKGQVIQRIIYDSPLAVFRNENGKVGCLRDRCLHRLALLSKGEVRGDHLTCMYHGWEYNLQGELQRVPSEDPNRPLKNHYCQQAYQVCEQDGVVWVWMGEAKTDTQPPWRFPFYQDHGWESYFMITDFNNEVTNLVENYMDVPHTVFVHRGWFRDEKSERKCVPTTVETKQGRVLVTYHQKQDELSLGAKLLINPHGSEMSHTDEFIYPNITRVDYWFGENGFIINSQCTPVSTMQSRVYTYIAFKVPRFRKLLKPVFQFYTRQVIEQDVLIMKNQAESLAFDATLNFKSTECDEVHVSIERLRHYGKIDHPLLYSFKAIKEINFWL